MKSTGRNFLDYGFETIETPMGAQEVLLAPLVPGGDRVIKAFVILLHHLAFKAWERNEWRFGWMTRLVRYIAYAGTVVAAAAVISVNVFFPELAHRWPAYVSGFSAIALTFVIMKEVERRAERRDVQTRTAILECHGYRGVPLKQIIRREDAVMRGRLDFENPVFTVWQSCEISDSRVGMRVQISPVLETA